MDYPEDHPKDDPEDEPIDFKRNLESLMRRAVACIPNQNFVGLKSSLDADNLVIALDDIDKAIEMARRKGRETKEVMNWMREADEQISGDLEKKLLKDGREKKCCFECCSNLKSHCQLNKGKEKYVEDVHKLLKEIRRTYYEEGPVITEPDGAPAEAVKDFIKFDSRNHVFSQIIEACQSPGIKSIGVHGVAGVGKTMLVEEIKRKTEKQKLFDDVVMAKVTKNPDWRRIQDDIARGLDLELLPDRVTATAADQIKSRLTDRKVLIILDNIWERIDLEKVGIPLGNKNKQTLTQPIVKKNNEEISSVEEPTECIVLMTSRYLDVLQHAHKIFEVDKLKDEEAWQLFVWMAGEQAKHHNMQLIERMVNDCQGLPIAIATLASTFEETGTLVQWKTTVKKLRSHWPSQSEVSSWRRRMSPSLYSAIKLRYSELQSKELKQTLFLCSLMGQNAGIQDLLKYGMGLELFPQAKSIGDARDEALKLVNELRRRPSLLLKGVIDSNMHFDMHDSVRDVVISIASEGHAVLTLRKDATEDMLDNEAVEESKWIYLSNADATQLPYTLRFPHLTFFHSSNKNPGKEIPDNFFSRMGELRVLGLTKMHFSSIPSSISPLVNLHTLCLDRSELGKNLGPIMGDLKNLQVLSLAGCDIEVLPQETEKLIKLKMLDLSDCTKLKVIPPNVLKSLSQLEELYLGNSFHQWEDIRENGNKRNASLDELTQLGNLTSLEVHIHEIKMIPDNLFSINLKRYKIFIGDVWNNWDSSFQHSKTLKLKGGGGISFDKVQWLQNKVEELHLETLNGARDVVNELDQNSFQELKYLHVKNDPEIQHVFFNSVKHIRSEVFPKLEGLFLHDLMGLKKIFHGQFEETSFKKLKIITVTCCNKLKTLFSFSVAKQLLHLQEIRVTDCSNIIEIVDDEEEEGANGITGVIELAAQIQCLRLQHLTEFISFSLLEKISRSRSTSLFNKKLVAGHRVWNLTKLIIEGCDQLEHLFFDSIGDCMKKLKQLEIRDCKKIRGIIVKEDHRGMFEINFPSLKRLAIGNCPELKGFVVDDSTGTDIIALFDDNVYFPALQRMTVSDLKNLKIIWHKFSSNSSFDSLNFLHIQDLPNLFGLCLYNYVREFSHLKQLTIEKCPQLSGFAVDFMSTDIPYCISALFFEEFAFPILERITISYLENDLKIFWKHAFKNSLFNLRSLRVAYCQNLSTIFSCNTEMPRKLLKSLEKLEITGCSSVEEVFDLRQSYIIERDEKIEENKLIFPKLKFIIIADCPNLVTFASTFSRDQEQGISEPFFSTKVEFSHLELLVVEGCGRLKYLMASYMVQRFSQLQKLVIRGCAKMEEVIMTEKFTENRISLFPKLDSIVLEDLPDLIRFCSQPQDQPVTTLFVFPEVTYLKLSKLPKLASFLPKSATEWPNLTNMHVCECDHVQTFALEFPTRGNQLESQIQHSLFWVNKGLEGQEGSPRSNTTELPAVSFVNLRTLEVSRCHGLITLLRYTIAKRLDQLSTMSITDCSKLKEIVACENDEVKDGIVFNQLTSLRLGLLSSLESFCSGECNFNFPSLQEVIVDECQKMNVFSKRVVKTEKLQKVKLTEEDDVGIWKDGDLNSSIQQLFIYKNHPAAGPLKTRTFPHFDDFRRGNSQGANAINEDMEKEDGQEEEDNENNELDVNELKLENSVSLDDSDPSVAQDAEESARKRVEVALSLKEKQRGEDAPKDSATGRNTQGANAIDEDMEKEDGTEKDNNEDDGLDVDEVEGENSVSLDDSDPSIAQDAQESVSKRGKFDLSSKEKKRGEDAPLVAHDAQEPASQRGEDAPIVAHDAQELASKRGEFDLSSKERKRDEDAPVVAHDAQVPVGKRGEFDLSSKEKRRAEDVPVVAHDAQEPASKRGEFDLSSKEKKRGEDACVVSHDAQEPASKRGEDAPIVAYDAQEPTSKSSEFDLTSKEKKRDEDAPVVTHNAPEQASKRGEFDLSSKEKNKGEDAPVVAHNAQEPASKGGEDAPIVADDAQEPASKRGEFNLSSKEKKRGEDASFVAHDAQEPVRKRVEDALIVSQDAQEPDGRRGEDASAECIVNAARLLGNYIIKEVNKESNKSIGFDMILLEKSSELDSALSKIEGLTEDERDIALSKLPDHPRQMVVFFNLSPNRRLAWVRRFLMYH